MLFVKNPFLFLHMFEKFNISQDELVRQLNKL
jgi:hypothetical protein